MTYLKTPLDMEPNVVPFRDVKTAVPPIPAVYPALRPINDAYPPRSVYLAGPITGLTYNAARESWRPYFASLLYPHIHAFSPMRVVSALQPEQGLTDQPQADGVRGMLVNRGILGRDESDLRHADVMVANFLGAERPSLGTVAEMGMAQILRVPVVLIMEEKGNVHEHPFVTAIAYERTASLEAAAQIVNHLLTPGV